MPLILRKIWFLISNSSTTSAAKRCGSSTWNLVTARSCNFCNLTDFFKSIWHRTCHSRRRSPFCRIPIWWAALPMEYNLAPRLRWWRRRIIRPVSTNLTWKSWKTSRRTIFLSTLSWSKYSLYFSVEAPRKRRVRYCLTPSWDRMASR